MWHVEHGQSVTHRRGKNQVPILCRLYLRICVYIFQNYLYVLHLLFKTKETSYVPKNIISRGNITKGYRFNDI